MNSEREFMARLAAADRSLQRERLPPAGVRRIAGRLTDELNRGGGRRRLGWVPMATFVAGAVLVLLFLSVSREPTSESGAPIAPRRMSQMTATGSDCRHEAGAVDDVTGACAIVSESPSMRIETAAGAHLSARDRTLRVHEGSALFDVDEVVGEPVRVATPGGEIVVVGTRFLVEVTDAGGTVELYEGHLEFHATDGSVTPIAAGQRLEFGDEVTLNPLMRSPGVVAPSREELEPPKVSPPAAESPDRRRKAKRLTPSRPQPAPAAEPRDAGALIEEVQGLRRSGQHAEAATRLEAALQHTWPKRTAEVLSNELGRILARHVGDPDRACRHWAEHLQQYPSTRFAKQIEASKRRLGCP